MMTMIVEVGHDDGDKRQSTKKCESGIVIGHGIGGTQLSVSHTRRLSYMHSHTRLMETHPSVTGIKHYGIV